MTGAGIRDLGPVLERTARDGAAYEPGVLPEPLRRALLAEGDAEVYAALPAVEGPPRVRQEGEHRVLAGDDLTSRPAVHALREAVLPAVRRHAPAIGGLDAWW